MFKHSVVVSASLLCLLATVYSYPANEKKDEVEEVDFVPLERQRPGFPFDFDDEFDRNPVVDTGYFPNSFGVRDYLSDMFRRMNERLNNLFRQIHELNETETTFGSNVFHVSGVDLSKAKNTSTTEVVNGHKVTVNKTEYDNNDENVHFHVQVINVAPIDDDQEDVPRNPNAEEITPASTKPEESPRDRESVEDTDNEIAKSREMYNYDIETLDETDNHDNRIKTKWIDNNSIERLESFEEANNKIVDLSNDIDVNRYLADAGAPINPDAEILDDVDIELLKKKSDKF